jgi:hypothetical protein
MNLVLKRPDTETRRYPRHTCDAMIEWSYLGKDRFSVAKLLNFSKGGIYFETDHDLKPGVTVFLKMNRVSQTRIDSTGRGRPRSVSLGEVQWRVDLSGGGKHGYGVGARYPGYPFPL